MENNNAKSTKRLREDFVAVRLKPSEREHLQTRAQALGMNCSNYLRSLMGFDPASPGPQRKAREARA